MFRHEKQLSHSVGVERPNPRNAALLQEQLGGGHSLAAGPGGECVGDAGTVCHVDQVAVHIIADGEYAPDIRKSC